MAYLRKSLAIDLGTASVLVSNRGSGVILNEPSVVATDAFTNKILAVGSQAKKMLGRTPGNIVATRPMKDGVIADFNATEKMLKYFIEKALGKSFFRPNLVVCVPSGVTQVEKRAVLQASANAGAYKTYLIEEPLAAAIGAGVDIADPSGNMIIDIGGGTTDVAVISMGGIVINKSIKIAGDECDEAISNYIRRKFNMLIGERTAELIKINIATAIPDEYDDRLFEVKGRNLINGLPMHVFVNSIDIYEALESTLDEIVKAVHECLDSTPPELAADLFEKGAILSGGGALIKDLDKKIEDRIGIKVTIAEDPISAVVRGTSKSISWITKLETEDKTYQEARKKSLEEKELLRKR